MLLGGGIKAAYLGNKMVWGDYYVGEQVDLIIPLYLKSGDADGLYSIFDWTFSLFNDNDGYDLDTESGHDYVDSRDDWYLATKMTDKINDLYLSNGIQYLVSFYCEYTYQGIGQVAYMNKSNDGYWHCVDEIFEIYVYIFGKLKIHGVAYGLCGWDGAAGNAYGGRIDYTNMKFDIGEDFWEGDTKIKDDFIIQFNCEEIIDDLQDSEVKIYVNAGRKGPMYKVKIIY